MRRYHNLFQTLASPEHLFLAWEAFRRGKGAREDVQRFEFALEENIFALLHDLRSRSYKHGPYHAFLVHDPKTRRIHRATVRDRVLHHALVLALNPVFEPSFIAHSFACRRGKGTHRGVRSLDAMLRSVSRNGTRACHVLKCDISRFYASVRHDTLLHILERTLCDEEMLRLVREVVSSFTAGYSNPGEAPRGLPLGNLTSQLFANVYLHELDMVIKHQLRVRHYVRYMDDFAIVSDDPVYLESLLPSVRMFIDRALGLTLHPRKVTIRKFRQGIDWLGYVLLPGHRGVRRSTRRRMFRVLRGRVQECNAGVRTRESVEQSLQSYRGVLKHANTFRIGQELQNNCWFWLGE